MRGLLIIEELLIFSRRRQPPLFIVRLSFAHPRMIVLQYTPCIRYAYKRNVELCDRRGAK